MAEFQEQVPELLQADLVRLDDLALAMSEVYRPDPSFAAPREVWERLREPCPDLPA